MHKRMNESGAALILLIGITATLAILSSTLVFVIQNEQRATASSRSSKQSLYAAEAALDSGVQLAKVGHTMSTTAEWLTPAELTAAFAGQFPAGAVVTYKVYDNLSPLDETVKWDRGGPTAAAANTPDGMMWVEAECEYQKKTTRARMLISQATVPFAEALPAAVTYSDTGIDLLEQSDIYAVNADGSAYVHVAGTDFPTSISAGGTWTPDLDAKGWSEVGRFRSNGTADLAAPAAGGKQSLGIKANGSVVTTGHSFSGVTVAPGTVGYLSDYFDQKAQASLADEAQAGKSHAAAPTAPTAPFAPGVLTASGVSVSRDKFSTSSTTGLTTVAGVTYTAATKTYSFTGAAADIQITGGNLTLTTTGTAGARGVFPAGTIFNFQKLSMESGRSLTITSTATNRLTVTTTSFYAGGALTITNPGTTTVPASFGQLHVVGALNVTGSVALNTTSFYAQSTVTIGNTTTTAVTDTLGQVYAGGAMSVTDRVSLTTTSLLANSSVTINNTTGTATSASLGNVRSAGAFSVSGPVTLTTSALYSGSSATIGNTGAAVADNLGAIYAVGDVDLSGNVTISAPSYLYGGGDVEITGPDTGATTDSFGLIYTSGTSKTLTFSENVQVLATAVVANGDFTISGATIPIKDWLGQVFVAAFSSSSNPSTNHGDVTWSGTASVTSRDYVAYNAAPASDAAKPKPMWLGRLWTRSGTYNDEYGNIWVPGNSGLSIDLKSTGNSTIMCPLLCTTERTAAANHIQFGTRAAPMVYFFMCDNNGIYPQVVQWASTGTFFGLMVINESTINFTNGVTGTPSVEGAVFAGCPYDPTHTDPMSKSDIVLNDQCAIAYNSAVVGAVATSSLRTTTVVTRTVPGSWQQLPAN